MKKIYLFLCLTALCFSAMAQSKSELKPFKVDVSIGYAYQPVRAQKEEFFSLLNQSMLSSQTYLLVYVLKVPSSPALVGMTRKVCLSKPM